MLRGGHWATPARWRLHRPYFTPSKRRVAISQTFPHPREAVFEVIADVGRYADFVPFCSTSRILARHGVGKFDAQLSLGFLAFTEEYTSCVRLTPPSTITATATDTPLFQRLDTSWRFSDGSAPGTCDLDFELNLLLRSLIHDRALAAVIDRVASEQVAAFRRRCDLLLSSGSGGRSGTGAGANSGIALGARSSFSGASSSGIGVQDPTAPGDVTGAAKLPSQSPARGASTSADSDASATATLPTSTWLRVEPEWRRRVDAAFDAHAVGGALTLGRFVEACRALSLTGTHDAGSPGLPGSAAADTVAADLHEGATRGGGMPPMHEMPAVALAAWFVEFDDDASGSVDRDEFQRHVWLHTHASEEERAAVAFAKLDCNASGAIERDDLRRSMRRQLALARQLMPLLVREQLREQLRHQARPCLGVGSMQHEALTVATAALDELDSSVDRLVAEVFTELGASTCITATEWSEAWQRALNAPTHDGDHADSMARMSGLDAVLGLMGQTPRGCS